jgi:hypothetical protein
MTDTDVQIKQHKVKVHVHVTNEQSFFAYMYIAETQRMQDIVNDERTFLPFEKMINEASYARDTYKFVVINKANIISIEEI